MIRGIWNWKNHGVAFKRNVDVIAHIQTNYECPIRCLTTSKSLWQNDSKNILSDKEKKIKIIQLEADVARQEGRRVPELSSIKDEHWAHLLALKTRSARSKYYGFLWQIEKKNENKKKKKIERQEQLLIRKTKEKLDAEQEKHVIYGLNHTCFLLRVYDSTINHWNNNKLIRAMQFGEKIVLDCSYDDHMNKREALNAAKQLMLSFAQNRMHDDPYDVHFCNANFQSNTMQQLQKYIPTMRDPEFPLNVHEKCFTDIFPKEKLVYLTPHCRNDLVAYNPDDIYIIGAIVDKVNSEPVSLAKAKKLGLRMARLPLDRYLQWGGGSGKSLTINQMIDILLDIKKTKDWNFALRHVPRRKIIDEEEEEETKKRELQQAKYRAKKFEFDIDSWGTPKKRARR